MIARVMVAVAAFLSAVIPLQGQHTTELKNAKDFAALTASEFAMLREAAAQIGQTPGIKQDKRTSEALQRVEQHLNQSALVLIRWADAYQHTVDGREMGLELEQSQDAYQESQLKKELRNAIEESQMQQLDQERRIANLTQTIDSLKTALANAPRLAVVHSQASRNVSASSDTEKIAHKRGALRKFGLKRKA